jgi:signal transduction histidine kinase/putative methionine-R-sulfoxide reductase with GAF domain/ActR/RegA family two-component response regulator
MSSQPQPGVPYGQSLEQWRLEQFNGIVRWSLIGAAIGFPIYLLSYFSNGSWRSLAVTGLIGVLGVLFWASGRVGHRFGIARGVNFFGFSLIGFLVISFLFQRNVIGFSIFTLLVPMVVANYLLEPKQARLMTWASALAAVFNMVIAVLNPFPAPPIPVLAAVAVNVLIGPIPIYIIATMNRQSASRTQQAITRLEQQSAALEETVRRRTAQLTTAAEIGRAATGSLDPDELLARIVNLIRDRFGYYHASIFLLDEKGENAIVRESTGEVGRILKERRHTLAVGSQSVIGYVTAQRKPRVALDVGQDAVHFKNPLLPETRSELAIPLLAGDRLLGALDVQSTEPNAFTATDVSVLQTLADQLAVAINNAELFTSQKQLIEDNDRLLADSRRAIEELNTLTGRLSREGWQDFMRRGRGNVSVSSQNGEHVPLTEPDAALKMALEKRDLISITDADRSALAAPIVLRDQIIGALALEETDPGHQWSADDLALAQEVADRLGLALDNARLLEQVNRERERLTFLFESARALSATLDLANVIDTALLFAPRIGAEYAVVVLSREATGGRHTFRSSAPGLEDLSLDRALDIQRTLTSRGLVQWVIEHQQPAIVTDAYTDSRWTASPTVIPARSVLIAPLRSPVGAAAGALAFTHSQPSAFTDDQLPFILSIATQLSAAINNAQLYQQVRRQQFGAEALARATQVMAQSLTEADLVQALANQIFDIFKPNGVIMHRWDAVEETLTPIAARVNPADPGPWPPLGQPFPVADRPELLPVLTERDSLLRTVRTEADGQIRELLGLPFLYNEEVEGALEFIHTGPAFGLSPDDVTLVQALLASAAFALQTARLYEQQLETAERLREVDRLKSQFLANMSHELRTPLNSIIGFSRVIMKGIDGPVTEVQLQDLTAIHNSGQHLLGLINDILDLSRIEAGKMELNFEGVDLTEIIKGVMSTTIGLIKDKPIKLISDIQPDLPQAHGDAIRLRQVLLNLMSNAAKFTDSGAITVRARVVQTEGQRSDVQISVIDTGPGIPEADQVKLFQTFSQVDGSATRKVGGSGLGLSISKQLVELLGGRIWLESTTSAGTTFCFTTPVHLKPQAEAPAPSIYDEHATDYRLYSVLAIDDDARLIDLYRRYLEPQGYILHGLVNPAEAVAAARALRPDIVLLDVLMPRHDGWQVLGQLKEHPDTYNIPVIVCSILTEREKALKLGAADYLIKPILDVDLLDALSRLNGNGQSMPLAETVN